MQDFLHCFQDQFSSEGGTAAMAQLQSTWDAVLKNARMAKVHVIEVFCVKALKQVHDAKAVANHADISAGIAVLAKQQAEISGGSALGLTEIDINPYLLQLAKSTVK